MHLRLILLVYLGYLGYLGHRSSRFQSLNKVFRSIILAVNWITCVDNSDLETMQSWLDSML